MAHLIDSSNDRDNMAFTGQLPWHGLGQRINADSSIEEWKTAAGLDWHIQKRPIFYGVENADGTREPHVIPDRFAHVRSDTQAHLGIGSNRFKLMQPGDTLEFYRDLVSGSRFSIETAGALNGGAKVWALARCNLDLKLGNGRDILKPYLLLATANDGTMATIADFTTVRVVCNNTLSMAVGHNGGRASIKVPHSRQFDADQVKAELGLVDERLETFATDADALATQRVTDEQAINYFIGLYAKTDEQNNVTNERTLKAVTGKLMQAYRTGPGAELESASGTAWGLMNAVTNFIDFSTVSRTPENRFSSGQFGHGATLKARAFDSALELVA
jgi:phage/plasmid-like protein (TIGR03299 family)